MIVHSGRFFMCMTIHSQRLFNARERGALTIISICVIIYYERAIVSLDGGIMYKNKILLITSMLLVGSSIYSADQDAQKNLVDFTSVSLESGQSFNQDDKDNLKATIVENKDAIWNGLQGVINTVVDHPAVVTASVLGLYGLYRTKDSIVSFVKKHPYITASTLAVIGGGIGSWYFQLPVKTYALLTAHMIIKVPLAAAQWMQGIMAMHFGFNYIKNIWNDEPESIGIVKNDKQFLAKDVLDQKVV